MAICHVGHAQLTKVDEKFQDGIFEPAVKYYGKKLKKNEADAYAKLGIMYDYGFGVEQDKALAHQYYQKSLTFGNSAIALVQIAIDYKFGEVVVKDRQVRDSLLQEVSRKKAVLETTPQGVLSLGMLFRFNDLSETVISKLKQLANQNIWLADYIHAFILMERKDADMNAAYDIFSNLANKGYRGAQANAANLLLTEFKRDYGQAEKYYQDAIAQQFVPAFYNYGRVLYDGNILPENKKKGIELIRKGVKFQNQRCSYMLGLMYEKGYTFEKNLDSAIYYFEKSYHDYSDDAMGRLGGIYLDKNRVAYDVTKGVSWLEKGVKLLDAFSYYRLGFYHVFEDKDKTTVKKGIKELEWALQAGYTEAAHALGLYYVDVNLEKARTYFEKNAKEGNARSAYRLGITYEAEETLGQKIKWIRQASASGYYLADLEMGHIFSTDFTPGDEEKRVNYDSALFYFKSAARKGSKNAVRYALGTLYKENRDYSNFAYWKSRTDSVAKANYVVGLFYHYKGDGDYVYDQQNDDLALSYYNKAVEMGYPKAFSKLGDIYSKGLLGITKDKPKARQYYETAIDLGYVEALKELSRAYSAKTFDEREQKLTEIYEKYDLPDALFEIGYQYAHYNVEQRDLGKGLNFMIDAAKKGSGSARSYLNRKDDYSYYDTISNQETKIARDIIAISLKAKNNDLQAKKDLAKAYLDKKHFFYNDTEGKNRLDELAKTGDFDAALYLLDQTFNSVTIDVANSLVDGKIDLDNAPRTRDTTSILNYGKLAIENIKGKESREDLYSLYSKMAFTEYRRGINKKTNQFAPATGLYWDKVFKYTDSLNASFFEYAAWTHFKLKNYEKVVEYHQKMEEYKIAYEEIDYVSKMVSLFETNRIEEGCRCGKYLYDNYDKFYKEYKENCYEITTRTATVYSKGRFVQSSIQVKAGDVINFSASGRVRLGAWAGSGGPDGIGGYTSYNIVRNARHGSLVGRIGSSNDQTFLIGSENSIKARYSGTLYFLINDSDSGNNSGSFKANVEIIREKGGS